MIIPVLHLTFLYSTSLQIVLHLNETNKMEFIAVKSEPKYEDDFYDQFFIEEEIKKIGLK